MANISFDDACKNEELFKLATGKRAEDCPEEWGKFNAALAARCDEVWNAAISAAHTAAAPSPAARFPASPEGWADALAYAEWKTGAVVSPKRRSG